MRMKDPAFCLAVKDVTGVDVTLNLVTRCLRGVLAAMANCLVACKSYTLV